MEQLSLFSKNTQSTPRGRNGNRRNVKTGRVNTPRWDLWTQETEAEKEMALFFLDIRNFTPLAERHQAVDVIHIVRKLFSTFQNIIRIHHGRIIETSGDGFYAAFGFDCDIKEAVNASVDAGMAILKILDNLNTKSFEKNLDQRIDVGIGIHAGKVATGNLQLGMKEHFVVMGYPVNVASRLQSATRQLNNNFIVSSEVFRMLKNAALLNNKALAIDLKGLSVPCEVHLIGMAYDG
jgi:adenylate cyclase